jgi:trypsin
LAILLALAVASSAGAESRRSASRSTHHRATRVEPAIRRARWRWPVRKWPTSLVPAARVLRSQYTGTRRRPQIVGGSGGVQGQWPFMAFIQHSDSAGNPDFWCSGTLVSSNVVLTAGHCAVDETTGAALDPSGYAVATGAVDWTNTANRQVSSVSQVNVYPAFDPSGPTHDAALLVLSSPLNAAPIALWASGGLSAGTSALIAGWGMTSAGQASPTALLQWAPTVVQSATDCRQKAALASFPYDTSTNLCAVNPPTYSTGTCNGDSGGPLLAQGASGTLVEIGLTSVGPTDCNTQQPDDFTAILPIASWVRNEASAVAPVTSRPTPSGAAPAPSGPSTSGTGSSAGTTPAALPSMTFPDARSTRDKSSATCLRGSLMSTPSSSRAPASQTFGSNAPSRSGQGQTTTGGAWPSTITPGAPAQSTGPTGTGPSGSTTAATSTRTTDAAARHTPTAAPGSGSTRLPGCQRPSRVFLRRLL